MLQRIILYKIRGALISEERFFFMDNAYKADETVRKIAENVKREKKVLQQCRIGKLRGLTTKEKKGYHAENFKIYR